MIWPCETIAANSAVREILANKPIDEDSPSPCYKVMLKAVHGIYQVFTDKEKAELVRRAAEHGITSTICYFTKFTRGGNKVKTNNVRTISASTLHGWKVRYRSLPVNSCGLYSSHPWIIASGSNANTVINATLR